ncbi:PP87 [Orf virus]|uniref:PP87 n=1 Tax=Orf virus TaxID=10258 RepID=F1AX43_ORFV|nr:PP87 [Orf virus]
MSALGTGISSTLFTKQIFFLEKTIFWYGCRHLLFQQAFFLDIMRSFILRISCTLSAATSVVYGSRERSSPQRTQRWLSSRTTSGMYSGRTM